MRIKCDSHFIRITFYCILYVLTILNYFHTKYFILYNISLCKRRRSFPSCHVEFLHVFIELDDGYISRNLFAQEFLIKQRKIVGRD
jgi:hypothetical protein